MAEEKEIVCPACQKKAERTTKLDKPVARLAARRAGILPEFHRGLVPVVCLETQRVLPVRRKVAVTMNQGEWSDDRRTAPFPFTGAGSTMKK